MRIETYPSEIKAADDAAGTWTGYGAVFGNRDDGGDIIVEGAFKKFRKKKNGSIKVPLFHNLERIVGEATVTQDEKGLFVEGRLDLDVPDAVYALTQMKNGSLDAMSVGFDILPKGADYEGDTRMIRKADLWEVSLVPFGMNPKARVASVKSMADELEIKTERDFERALRDLLGFTRRQAKAITAGGYKTLTGDLSALPDEGDSYAGLCEMLRDAKNAIAS